MTRHACGRVGGLAAVGLAGADEALEAHTVVSFAIYISFSLLADGAVSLAVMRIVDARMQSGHVRRSEGRQRRRSRRWHV